MFMFCRLVPLVPIFPLKTRHLAKIENRMRCSMSNCILFLVFVDPLVRTGTSGTSGIRIFDQRLSAIPIGIVVPIIGTSVRCLHGCSRAFRFDCGLPLFACDGGSGEGCPIERSQITNGRVQIGKPGGSVTHRRNRGDASARCLVPARTRCV